MIAVSEFTKRELVDAARASPTAKIRVVPNAVEDVFTPDGPRAEGDYVLAVGTLEPRKNLARIAAAVDGELRVVGARGWGGVEPPANVTWLGDVADEELAALYRGARCLVYASLYEGFGIPVAEALACGCPVVTSRGSPMAELAGDDAVYVDPTDVDVDPRRHRARVRAGAAAGRDAGPTSPRRRARSTRSSRDPRRRRRARPQAHRRRDLRAEPAARAAASSRPTSTSPRSRATPSSCPTGVEAIELPARSQELRMAWSLPRLLRRLRPELAHFQHALPLGWRGRVGRDAARPALRARPDA